METTKLLLALAWCSVSVCSMGGATGVARAADPPGSKTFIDHPRQGWFFYQDPPAEAEEDAEESPVSVTIDGLPPGAWLEPSKYRTWFKGLAMDGVKLTALPVTVLRELVSAKKERALDDPSVENVTSYIKVQKEAYDRSQRFTDAWQIAMYTDPKLDYASQHPTSTYGHSVESEIKRNTEEQLLAGTADRVGLFFFFTSTCPFCQEQSKVLKVFADTYGLTVKPVSLDGVGLPEYPQPAINNGMAENVGVHMVPMIYLAIPEENFLKPLGAGLMTNADLRERLLVLLRNRGLLGERPSHG
ncbi:MAG: conjugal transfer protein TraF [Bdellovibrionales bacterium]|nr:conjugal transfer protein TraF [Bdellovibrionales bacterium]